MTSSLTQREITVLEMLGQGKYKKDIAKELKITYYGLCKHIQNIVQKIGARNTVHAVYLALRGSLIE